jgi:hypothetical protein
VIEDDSSRFNRMSDLAPGREAIDHLYALDCKISVSQRSCRQGERITRTQDLKMGIQTGIHVRIKKYNVYGISRDRVSRVFAA